MVDTKYLNIIKTSYQFIHDLYGNDKIPQNLSKKGELMLRNLDCAVIEATNSISMSTTGQGYDSVRGVFFEGDELYNNAGFREKNHIQIALRNPNCIKGYFIPRALDPKFSQL